MEEKNIITNENLFNKVFPLVPLRGKVLFPKTVLNFDAGRPMSVAAIDAGAKSDSIIFISTQKNVFLDSPKKSEIYKIGTLCKIKQVIKVPNGTLKVSVESIARAKIEHFVDDKAFYSVTASLAPYVNELSDIELEAYFRVAKTAFLEFSLLESTSAILLAISLDLS